MCLGTLPALRPVPPAVPFTRMLCSAGRGRGVQVLVVHPSCTPAPFLPREPPLRWAVACLLRRQLCLSNIGSGVRCCETKALQFLAGWGGFLFSVETHLVAQRMQMREQCVPCNLVIALVRTALERRNFCVTVFCFYFFKCVFIYLFHSILESKSNLICCIAANSAYIRDALNILIS